MKQKQKNSREAGEKRFDVIVDYLWGRPTEALLKAITGKEFAIGESETRLVEVGESARISEEVGITPHFFYGAVITSFCSILIRFIASISFNRPYPIAPALSALPVHCSYDFAARLQNTLEGIRHRLMVICQQHRWAFHGSCLIRHVVSILQNKGIDSRLDPQLSCREPLACWFPSLQAPTYSSTESCPLVPGNSLRSGLVPYSAAGLRFLRAGLAETN